MHGKTEVIKGERLGTCCLHAQLPSPAFLTLWLRPRPPDPGGWAGAGVRAGARGLGVGGGTQAQGQRRAPAPQFMVFAHPAIFILTIAADVISQALMGLNFTLNRPRVPVDDKQPALPSSAELLGGLSRHAALLLTCPPGPQQELPRDPGHTGGLGDAGSPKRRDGA